jgi:hypothetical protein
MSHTVQSQHPPVALRAHHRRLQALLVIAAIAIVGLTAAVVILASDDGNGIAASSNPLSSMTAKEQRYVTGMSALTDRQLGAAFGSGRP